MPDGPTRGASVSGITLRFLSGQSRHDQGILSRITNVPSGLQGPSNVGIFRATIEGNQSHAVRTLNLVTVLHPVGSLGKRLPATRTDDLNPIGHEGSSFPVRFRNSHPLGR
jgi:hypothetical protein